MGNKFNYRTYDESASNRETRKDQKIKHQLFDQRTGRIPKADKVSHRVNKRIWQEDDMDVGYGEG
jgi:hypothetical protein